MVRTTTKVTLDGNFFRRDPGKTIRHNITAMQDALAPQLESAVRAEIAGHASQMPGWTGWTASHIVGYTTSGRTGNRWHLWSAVAASTTGMGRQDAIRTKAAAASIEARWHPFRRVKSAVYRMRAVIAADLTKGLE